MTTLQKSAQEQLRQHVERIERLEQDRKDLAADVRDQFTLLKSQGFDVKTVRKILKLRTKSSAERQEEDAILATYMHALSMDTTPLGSWAKQIEDARSGDVGGITYEQRVDAVARAHGIGQDIADEVKADHAKRGRKLYPSEATS